MIIAALLLSLLSVVVLYSSSPTQAIQQALYCLVGLILYLVLSNFDYRALGNLVKYLYALAIIGLIIVFIIGFETRGSVRWIPLGLINLQPSELAKPVLILALAFFWAKRLPSWRNIFYSLLITGPLFLLIFRQPDLGTALTVGSIWLTMLIIANVSWVKMLVMGLVTLIAAPLGWSLLQEYQKQRIFSFILPTQDPLGQGFHVIQSMIAVGSGEFIGRGLGRGTQSRLQFLPEFRTDFIFAFIAEELGFMGGLIVLALYGVIFTGLIRIIYSAEDRLGQLIVAGVMGMTFFQVLVNIGMNIGIMPVTGITLPLVSYGGSSMLATYICLGLAASVKKYSVRRHHGRQFDPLSVTSA